MTESVGDVAFFDRFARCFDLFHPESEAEEIRAGLALADREIERVLDVGGGTGRGASAVDASERIVADPAPGMLSRARQNGMEAVRADGARLPFADSSVDAVLVVDALHHFGDPTAAVPEFARVLRPGGVLVVREFDPTVFTGRLVAVGERLVGFDSTFFAPEILTRTVGDAGLDARYRTDGYEYTVAGVAPGAE